MHYNPGSDDHLLHRRDYNEHFKTKRIEALIVKPNSTFDMKF